MKTNSLVIIAGLCALMGIATAEEGKVKAAKKEIAPEILEKYDADKDGKLNKEEKAAMKKDKEAAAPKKEKKTKKPKAEEGQGGEAGEI